MTSPADREIYTEAEAARLLRVRQSTLHYWLDGPQRTRRHHRPIIRDRPCGSRTVTWAEFVEAAFLRECRRTHKVPIPELRTLINQLREGSGLPHPLADTFIRRFDWAGNVAVGYRPDDNPESPVRIRPDVRFGKPSIKGVSTEVIGEQHDAGENAETIAKMYALEPPDVAWALSYESSLRTCG